MKHYEIMAIYNIDLGEEGALNLSKEVKDLIISLDGKIVSDSFWGKRRFAYRIGLQEDGYYDVVQLDLDGAKMSDLKSKLNGQDDLIRYLITALE